MVCLARLRRAAAIMAVVAAFAAAAVAQETTYFRIGTGATGETRFAIGGLVANAISNPPGSRECSKGGSCGVPGLIAVAQSTNGAGANVDALGDGGLEAALVHADVAYWALRGSGLYKNKGPVGNLRAIAALYPDAVQLVAREGASIGKVKDLKGKRVSLGEKNSATLADSRLILAAYGLREKNLQPRYLAPAAAAEALRKGEIDAFFVVDGAPSSIVTELAKTTPISLVALNGPEITKLCEEQPFLQPGMIPAATYAGVDSPIPTVNLSVMLLVRADLPHELVYGITRALWHPSTQDLLSQTNPRGRLVHLDAETERLAIPLHPGAAAYYVDSGIFR